MRKGQVLNEGNQRRLVWLQCRWWVCKWQEERLDGHLRTDHTRLC